MQDTLKVRVKDILTLLESDLYPMERQELETCILDLLHENWRNEKVVEFNEDSSDDVVFLVALRDVFLKYKIPYVYYSDGDDREMYDAYYEYYNKDISERPTTAYRLYNENGYAISYSFLLDHRDDDAETFKQAVIRAITSPFEDYPDLDTME